MAQSWYPVIDYTLCAECGSCINKCTHGVYNKAKAPVPVVVKPEACVDHCHGCGNLCPNGAITYVGDNTGWTPPHGHATDQKESCGCGCGSSAPRENGGAAGCEGGKGCCNA